LKNKLEEKRKIEFFINKLYHIFFGEKFSKKIKFNFDNRSRLDLINHFINKNNFLSYLEIGCHLDEIFNEIKIEKIGVDPISGGTFRGTSDEFFLQNKKNFDCIFIDGLHTYDQVIKDIKNSIQFLNKDGVIILHDCLPPSASHQRVPRTRYTWNGDVWKAIVEIRTYDNLDTYTVLADQGLGVIKKRDNSDILKLKNINFKKIKFKYYYNNYKSLMRTVTFDEALEKI
jgi:hypothetical protein